MFKSIVLLNADFLTIDAQSALRRCIEQFSLNTRFFIIVENKNKLLNPILSRFCEIYFPDTVNLHQYQLKTKYDFENLKDTRYETLCKIMEEMPTDDYIITVGKVNELYSEGYSAVDLNGWLQRMDGLDDGKKAAIELCFEKVKSEYRCEKLLMLYLLNQMNELMKCENNVEWTNNIGFI